MRLKIKLRCKDLRLPLSYKYILQATIYSMLPRDTIGDFYHNQGYDIQEKKYKLFVFSDLYGSYSIQNNQIVFKNEVSFSIASLDIEFIKTIYSYLEMNRSLYMNKQCVEIDSFEMNELAYFSGVKTVMIKTLSPITAYTSKDHYFTYYKPSDDEFEELIINNLEHKVKAFQYPIDEIVFKINDVIYEKKKILYFKKTMYVAYQSEMRVQVNFDTLNLIYLTGLSAKGSCGFGMIDVKYEKDNVHL